MAATLALAGDTMLGRGVAERLSADPTAPLIAPQVADQLATADAFVLNLECCISDRGEPFPDPAKPFFFRAPPVAASRLAELGVDAVTLANNHALDYGPEALQDTLTHLDAAGIAAAGAGADDKLARTPVSVRFRDVEVRLVAFSDHPAAYAAAPERPGIAFADLHAGLPRWLDAAVRTPGEEFVLVTPHWGPNMVTRPSERVRRAAEQLRIAGASLIAGHSAHVFQGVTRGVLFDLGDFLDDYAVNPQLRNDLGLLWLVDLESNTVQRIRALPLFLDYCYTELASPTQADWILDRLRELCTPFGTEVESNQGMIELRVDRVAAH
jgi:poly-gamma-glutamate capsule biosynthesis protein CapA/YwtB (metallophosphatase superfamily)